MGPSEVSRDSGLIPLLQLTKKTKCNVDKATYRTSTVIHYVKFKVHVFVHMFVYLDMCVYQLI